MADTSDLFTTVRNPLSKARFYGYLGYHGKTLLALAHFTQVGSLVDYIAGGKPTRKRWTDALQNDLLAVPARIEIISTPSPILVDDVSAAVKVLDLSGGALGVTDPSWGAYTDT